MCNSIFCIVNIILLLRLFNKQTYIFLILNRKKYIYKFIKKKWSTLTLLWRISYDLNIDLTPFHNPHSSTKNVFLALQEAQHFCGFQFYNAFLTFSYYEESN